MIPHEQKNGLDCYRTAVACILDLSSPDEIPCSFTECRTADQQAQKMREWLSGHGLNLVRVAFNGDEVQVVLDYMEAMNPGAWWLLSGASGNRSADYNHVVVCQGGRIAHDPSPAKVGLSGPCHGSGQWVAEFIVVQSWRG